LIDCNLANQIITYEGQGNILDFLRKFEDRALVVSVDDPFIRMDVDTEEDLSRLRKELIKKI